MRRSQDGCCTLGFAMERVGILLGVFVWCNVAAQSMAHNEDSAFSRVFPSLFEDAAPFQFKNDFVPYLHDLTFSSWPTQISEFRMLEDWPPIPRVPRVEVSCDNSRVTVLVWKDLSGVTLTADEVQLGDGCYRTAELPNQLVFSYNVDECGTSHVMQNGLESFTNSLHIHDLASAWWKAPSTVDITCAISRPDVNTNLVGPQAPPENDTRPSFNMRAVNSLWTGCAGTNVYNRGQIINLQVSANTRPEQEQLFVRSCFISASPEPHTRPQHAVIMNKGCAAWSGSAHSAAQFLASHQAGVVNFALNTADLISEVYVHCSVFLSDQGVTFGSKSCNYDATEARWKELNGVPEVCDCCSAKCKGPSVKISEDVKSIVSAGPFVIIDKDVEKESSSSGPEDADSMQSDGPDSVDPKVSGESPSREELHPRSVVTVRQEPNARRTGDAKPEEMSSTFHDHAEHRPSTTDEEPLQETPTNVISADGVNVVALAGIPLHLEAETGGMKRWLERLGLVGVKARREVDARLNEVDATGQEDFSQKSAEPLMLDVNRNGAVIRSKVQFTKTVDGTQTLSYEEEMMKPEDGRAAPRCGMKTHQELGRRRKLRSTFLNFLRRLNGAE